MDLILADDCMIGRQLSELLPNSVGTQHESTDLTDMDQCINVFKQYKYNTVYALSGLNGGIGMNLARGADIFYTTSLINLNVLKCCQVFKVNRVVVPLASCSYPNLGNKFLTEDELWVGPSDPSVSSHGHAKRMIDEYGKQLFKQYGIKVIRPILTNCYGPGDRFNLERTKVVGACVRRLYDAHTTKQPSVTFYGSGKPLREIMYCRDAAACLIQLAEKYDDYMNPVNVGSDKEISIYDLVHLVKDIVGYEGKICWDTTKPDGQMRKKLSTTKMKKYVNHEMINLIDGLKKTVEYYREVGQYLDR